ncbi:MAG: alpha/beta fold hydrolase [Caulobacteraceae bacterium]
MRTAPRLIRSLLLALAAALAFSGAGRAQNAFDGSRSGRIVRLPDGRRMNFRCEGVGSPTVILEGGYEATSLGWTGVARLVARNTRVCAYDRAGAGFSDPGPLPRDGAAIARDLDEALRAGRIAGPYVLVGHSAGGLYVRLFAERHPHDVAGMVLVEPSVPFQPERFSELFGPGAGSVASLIEEAQGCLAAAKRGALPSSDPALASCAPKPSASEAPGQAREDERQNIRASTWRARLSEIETLFTSTSAEVEEGPRSLGAMPLIVLTAGEAFANVPEPVRGEVRAAWISFHRQIAALSSRGREEVVPGATHMMIIDHPAAVASAVEQVVDQARAFSSAGASRPRPR